MMDTWTPHLPHLKDSFESVLRESLPAPRAAHFPPAASQCAQAHCHPVQAGGKRVRPLLTLLTAGALGGQGAIPHALPAAVALELIHTYSLVHDDLPSMDNAPLRRGLPTTHTLYGEGAAVLVGDGLLTHAFWVLSRGRVPFGPCPHWVTLESLEILAHAAGPQGMVLGQWVDIHNIPAPTTGSLEERHALKTGALFGASCAMGLLSAIGTVQVSQPTPPVGKWVEDAFAIGQDLGVVYQMADDILDVEGSPEAMGKPTGLDAANGRGGVLSTGASKDHVHARALNQLHRVQERMTSLLQQVAYAFGCPQGEPQEPWVRSWHDCTSALVHRSS